MATVRQKTIATELKRLLERATVDYCLCIGHVSLACCQQIIEHHERDMLRLKAVQPGGIHPTKHIGYLIFWIRKLKPIQIAFSISDYENDTELDDAKEIVEINELACVYIAQHLLLSYADDGVFTNGDLEQTDRFKSRMIAFMKRLLSNRLSIGPSSGNVAQAIMYDMRHRTFGPHHVVHFLNHILYACVLELPIEE